MGVRRFAVTQIAEIARGEILAASDVEVLGVSLDSRTVARGMLFAALKGDKVDGHDFCAAAASAGAACLLVERPVVIPEGCGGILVPSVDQALRFLASEVRSEFRGEVIAVVGSCGKTTTKDFTAAVLRRMGTVHATEGNRNNLLGLPETLLCADMDCRFWVLELGISTPGEMENLAPMARPTGVIMTTIQPVHTEFFPSLEAIRDEKVKVFGSAEPGSFAALNIHDPLLRDLHLPHGSERILYGMNPGADVWVERTGEAGPEGTPFRLHVGGESAEGFLPVPGAHNLLNFAGACAAGWSFGAKADLLAEAASDLKPAPHRGEVHRLRDDVLLLDDSYNANPAAMAAVLGETRGWGRRVVGALGEMLELGSSSKSHHEDLGRFASEAGLAALLAVGGESAGAMARAFSSSGRPVLHAKTWREGAEWLDGQICPGDGVVVKGSRGIGLDGIAAWLLTKRGA